MTFLFSIVITCHNYERYVGKAIQSAQSQTYDRVEIIVVDASSTDKSRDIIKSFTSITLVDAPKGSHALACNAGFQASSGDIIIFLDADDLIAPDACKKIASTWTSDTVKTQYNLQIIDKHGTSFDRTVCKFPKYYSPHFIKASFEGRGTYVWPPTSGNAYASSYCEKVFPLNAALPPDGQMNTMAPSFGEIQVINESIGLYRLHDTNLDYQSHKSFSLHRFSKSVRRRYREYSSARRKARKLGRKFPKQNILNHEFSFISYRLFLKQCGHSYIGSLQENRCWLFCLLLKYFITNPVKPSFAAKALAWHGLLLFCPSPLALKMIKLRFERDIG
jgi:glycosyltransferase involved in cell wall biosynthesis